MHLSYNIKSEYKQNQVYSGYEIMDNRLICKLSIIFLFSIVLVTSSTTSTALTTAGLDKKRINRVKYTASLTDKSFVTTEGYYIRVNSTISRSASNLEPTANATGKLVNGTAPDGENLQNSSICCLKGSVTKSNNGSSTLTNSQNTVLDPEDFSSSERTRNKMQSKVARRQISLQTMTGRNVTNGSSSQPNQLPILTIRFKEDRFLPPAFSHELVVTFTVLYILIIFLAFFGNLLVIFVIAWARMVRSFTDLFILSLAVSDILISTFNMPIQLKSIVINDWTMGDFLCKFTTYLQAVTIVANILTLTAIAVDRYLVICHSEISRKIHTKRFAILGLVIVWLLSLCVVCPQIIFQRIQPMIKMDFKTKNILGISHVCVEYFPKGQKNNQKIFSLTIFIGVYLVPVLVMVFTYGAIARRLWIHQPNLRNNARSIKQKRKVIKMLMLLVAEFTVLWFPFFSASLYQDFVKIGSTFRINLVILQLVGYSSCCFNPIIYTFLNKKFQVEFKRIFCRRRRTVITSIHTIERRSNPRSNPPHSNQHAVHPDLHSSSHNDVIVQGLNKTADCSHI